jgi:hypothetical protein
VIEQRNKRRGGAFLALLAAGLLVVAGLTPSGSLVYSQQRSAQRSQPNQPTRIYYSNYVKGYNEGFGKGQADWKSGAYRDFERRDQYQQRDRSYPQGKGSSDEYLQGYQLGLELGYSDGYYGRARNSAVPANATSLARMAAVTDGQRTKDEHAANEVSVSRGKTQKSYPPLAVPENTEMRLRLTTPINTKTNRVGDRFTAAITSPSRYNEATVEGHIASLDRSGRISGRTELGLTFDSISLEDGEQGPLNADLERIMISEQVKMVDEEGRIETGSRTRDSEIRGGVGAAAGAIIGGIVGGGKGAILGLILGGAAGVGTVYVEGNKDLILDVGTEMVIRTAGQRKR